MSERDFLLLFIGLLAGGALVYALHDKIQTILAGHVDAIRKGEDAKKPKPNGSSPVGMRKAVLG